MKITAIIILAMGSVVATAQTAVNYADVLPGVVKVNEYLYYDQTEVSNSDWLEYLQWLEQQTGDKTSNAYRSALPDTGVWNIGEGTEAPLMRYYLRHPAYAAYPVVGVTWQQASEYCAWRTERVMKQLASSDQASDMPLYFAYRLPIQSEFETMYDNTVKLPDRVGAEGKRKLRGSYRYTMKREVEDETNAVEIVSDNADITAPVRGIWPNDFGVHHIRGNVAEWLSAANTYAGGSWMDSFDQDVKRVAQSTAPSAAIGFRCACEVANEAP
ncbi:MAG: SUMF1/EgtB/PvdO family nonheme iron enzyme [Cryomorphaceae bacterium]